MFVVIIFQFFQRIITYFLDTRGLPLSYILIPHFGTFSWFYIPLTAVMLLSVVTITGGVAVMLIGKHISKTPGDLFIGIVTYLFIFGFIAPFWLMRSMYDLLTGTRRAWR
jgi:hypothetical protein